MHRIRAATRLTTLVGLEVAALVVLHHGPSGPSPTALLTGGATLSPEDAVVATARILALGLAWWLAVTTVAYATARIARWPRAVRALRPCTAPGLRRVVDAALAVSLGTAALGIVAPAAGATPPPTPTVTTSRPRAVVSVAADGSFVVRPTAGTAGETSPTTVGASPVEHPVVRDPADHPATDAAAEVPVVRRPARAAGPAAPTHGAPERTTTAPRPVVPPSTRRSDPAPTSPPATSPPTRSSDPPTTPPPANPMPASPAPAPLPPTVHRVVAGENLWTIAAARVRAARGTDAPAAVGPYWRRVVAANRPTLRSGNPDLVFPGEVVALPALDRRPV